MFCIQISKIEKKENCYGGLGNIVKVFIVVRGVESVFLRQDDGKLGEKRIRLYFLR